MNMTLQEIVGMINNVAIFTNQGLFKIILNYDFDSITTFGTRVGVAISLKAILQFDSSSI